MKKTILLSCIVAAAASCKPEAPKDYVSLSGVITNPNEDLTLEIRKGRDYLKTITLNEDGSFSDTLKIPEDGKYYLIHNKENAGIFLSNGDLTSFTLNTEEFDESLKFEGGNADKNNFVVANYILNESTFDETSYKNEANYLAKFEEYKKEYEALKATYNLDTGFYSQQDTEVEKSRKGNLTYIIEKETLKKELTGVESPSFQDYENYKGGTSSLSDFKGKFVYVDVWATWCGPCKAEIPSLKKVEQTYEGKNIEFLSISVDALEDKEAWKAMIAEKGMGGVQVFSDNSWKSDFVVNYRITGIPRFILIGPDGKIISPDAPRPSDANLIELFDSQGI
ncbi:MAG: TlpA disulfide reductase family protein [Flavobacteriales bacterium]